MYLLYRSLYEEVKERSRNKDEIIKEVQELGLIKGIKKSLYWDKMLMPYGKDFKDIDYTFGDLLMDLDKTGLPRIPLYQPSHPRDLDYKTVERLIEILNICYAPHLHLPVTKWFK